MRGVILDLDSLGQGDLDLSPLLGLPGMHWELHGSTPAENLHGRIREAEVVLSNKVVLDREALSRASGLRLVVVMATGTNNVDLDAAAAQGVVVCNVRNYAVASVAEHTLGLMLALARRLPEYLASSLDGSWSRSDFFCVHRGPMLELAGRRLGIVGHGALGAAVARLGDAFGMEVSLASLPGHEHGHAPWPRLSLGELLGAVDVLSLHCPLTPQTRGLIGAQALSLMKPGAFLLNTARGALIDEAALLAALRGGRLGGAALDTLDREPPPGDSALIAAAKELPNLLVTPHVAWASREARQRLVWQMREVIAAFRGGSPINRVG